MGLREQLAEHSHPFEALLAVASCRESLGFLDLLWAPLDFDAFRDRLIAQRDPGVIFETANRVVVLEEHDGELRFYAGGWCPDQSRIYLEQDRIAAEGSESGVFPSLRDALAFAAQYLVEERDFAAVQVRRDVRYSCYHAG